MRSGRSGSRFARPFRVATALAVFALSVFACASVAQAGCDPGYYGPMCDMECPGGAATPCNGNGTCGQGTEGSGTCSCNSGYGGAACDQCGEGFTGYPACTPVSTTTTTTTLGLPLGACAASPVEGCLQSAVAKIKILATKQFVIWKALKGQAFEQPVTNDPSDDAYYSLCVYDYVAAVPSLAVEIVVAPGSLWTNRDPKGWKYKDPSGGSGGATLVLVKTGSDDHAKVLLKAKAGGLVLPDAATEAEFFALDSKVTAQLVNSSSGGCFTTDFTTAKKNDPTTFISTAP